MNKYIRSTPHLLGNQNFDDVIKELRVKYPNYTLFYKINITFPRYHRLILYADPSQVDEEELERYGDELYAEEQREACEY